MSRDDTGGLPPAVELPPAADAIPVFRRLHVQAALVIVPVLVALALAMSWVLDSQLRENGLEAKQRMNLALAHYIVAHQAEPLIDARGLVNEPAMKAMATQAMMINPAIEVYLLDARGVVRAHALADLAGIDPVGRRVDLVPVHVLALSTDAALSARLPVLGEDPRDAARRTIISVAALPSGPDGASPGWLYVVLEAARSEAALAALAPSRMLRAGAWMLGLATLVAAVFAVIALRRLTRPLRELTGRVQGFHRDDEAAPAPAPRDEIALLAAAIAAMQRRIEQQLTRLQEADRLRRELIGSISHDLRTPLSNIQGYVETVLLRADRLDPETRAQHLRTALRHVELLGKRVADLFELSTLDAGRVEPRIEVFCLAELLQDVIHGYRLEAGERGVALSLEAGSQLTTQVRADIGLIERVLQNLVDNALRHTPAGGTVTLAVEARGAEVEVSVVDTGSGIAHEHLPHIFERYWRAEDEPAAVSSDDDGGRAPARSAGLGLAIVKRILDLHGSTVRVRSAPSEGACFAFVLPRAG
jgi:signal transduction histidine kinase